MMKPSLALVVSVAIGLATAGCASKEDSPSTLHITGTVGQQSSAVTGARAVAISNDGRSFSALLRANGSFALDVPVGGTYRLVIANPTRTGELRVVGHLVNTTTNGATDVIAAKGGGTLALGALRPAGSSPAAPTTTTGTGAVSTMSVDGAEAEDGAEHEDAEEKETDDDHEGNESDDDDRLCQDGDDVELEAEHDPGPEHEASAGSAAPKSAAKSCDVHDVDHDGDDD